MSGEALKPGDKVWVLATVVKVPEGNGVAIRISAPMTPQSEGRTWHRDPLPDAAAAYERGRAEATAAIVVDLRALRPSNGDAARLRDFLVSRYERGEHLAGAATAPNEQPCDHRYARPNPVRGMGHSLLCANCGAIIFPGGEHLAESGGK